MGTYTRGAYRWRNTVVLNPVKFPARIDIPEKTNSKHSWTYAKLGLLHLHDAGLH